MKKITPNPMKKITSNKLTLHAQTLRELAANQLHGVVGGAGIDRTVSSCIGNVCYLH